MEMDEMELDRYITGMMDTERRNMKKDVRAGKKHKQQTETEQTEPKHHERSKTK